MHDVDWDLLHRYSAGEATLDERARFEAWRDASPARQVFIEALLKATAEPPALPLFTERDKAETWARLERTIAGERGEARPAPLRRFSSFPGRRSFAGIAAMLSLLGAAAGVRWLAQRRAPAVPEATADHVLTAPRGQRATFELPDGTRIVLGPASTLRYTAAYGRHARDVRLQGEAYFAVVHDERRPFTVYAADLVTRDLGTEFIVRAYPEDARPVVVVREGEVGIRAAAAADATVRVVVRSELGRLSSRGEPVVEAVELEPYFAWTEGRLVFDAMPLREVLRQLNRWFDLDLRLADSTLGGIPVDATFDRRPTAEVLKNMAAGLDLTYVERGRTGYFHRRAASAAANR